MTEPGDELPGCRLSGPQLCSTVVRWLSRPRRYADPEDHDDFEPYGWEPDGDLTDYQPGDDDHRSSRADASPPRWPRPARSSPPAPSVLGVIGREQMRIDAQRRGDFRVPHEP